MDGRRRYSKVTLYVGLCRGPPVDFGVVVDGGKILTLLLCVFSHSITCLLLNVWKPFAFGKCSLPPNGPELSRCDRGGKAAEGAVGWSKELGHSTPEPPSASGKVCLFDPEPSFASRRPFLLRPQNSVRLLPAFLRPLPQDHHPSPAYLLFPSQGLKTYAHFSTPQTS